MSKQKQSKKIPKEERKHNENSSMYFKIDLPLELRKGILKTAIEVTQLLKRHEGFKGLRHLRAETYQEFNKIYKEIDLLSRKLRTKDLPVIKKVREEIKKAEVQEQRPVHVVQHPGPVNALQGTERPRLHISEEDKIDNELREIQRRLHSLDI